MKFLSLVLLCAATVTGSDISAILDQCYGYLDSHLCEGTKWDMPYHFYRPSIDKYSADQWLWDSGAHMIVWAQKNVTNAILDLRTMLQVQRSDGFIPEEIFWSERNAIENIAILTQYSNVNYTDITQMPVLPYSLRAIHTATQDASITAEFLYPLIKYFTWWRETRDLGDGLVIALHNWETGLDASPAYDPAFHVYITEVNQSSWAKLYPKFHQTIHTYRFMYDWNTSAILSRTEPPPLNDVIDTWFMMKDLALNCVYASGWRVLSELAAAIGDMKMAEYCLSEAKRSSAAIQSKMWSEEQQRYQSMYTDWDNIDKHSIANTVQNLFPLLLDDLPEERVAAIVSELRDTTKFAAPYSIPTVAMDDPQFCADFDADLMWRGPVWGFTNWFLLEGLGLHGEMELQEEILNKWVTLVDKSGIYEMYNPLTGEPYGPEGLGMSTLVCDWIYRYGWDKL